jgi:uncharacterized protein with PIN domain
MIYDINNATFITMMYQSPVALKPGEKHCPYCSGYAIRPMPRERRSSARSQRHEDCTFCDKKGKTQ